MTENRAGFAIEASYTVLVSDEDMSFRSNVGKMFVKEFLTLLYD